MSPAEVSSQAGRKLFETLAVSALWYRSVSSRYVITVKWIPILAALLTTAACASTGATPRPFPGAAVREPSPAPQVPDLVGAASGSTDLYALVGTALSLRGIPYRNGGSDPGGFDCSGFTQYVFAQYGIALPREVREQYHQGQEIDARDLSPGDLVFFATSDPGASHVAIVIGSDQFVHAPSSTGVVRVERLRSSYWSQRFIGARRIVPQTATQQQQ
jgi:cell wall-associated NlpC family hydrolase